MGDATIARLLHSRLSKEKLAFVPILGGAANAVGQGVWRAAQIAPGTTAMGTAATVALAPGMIKGDPHTQAAKRQANAQRRYLAAQAGGMMGKRSSVQFDIADVRRAQAIGRGLEKSARIKIPTIEGIGGLGNAMVGAAMFGPAALAAGIGLGAAGAATMGVSYGIGKGTEIARGALQGRRYNKMLKADPSLKKNRMARIYFNVLDKASPYIAGEPHVAAATVRSMLEAPEGYALHPKYMKDILGVEESRQKTRFPMLRAPVFKGELPDVG